MKLRCKKKCFWLSLINEGEEIEVKDESEVPPEIRPFFEFPEKAEADAVAKTEETEATVEAVRAELDRRGKPYDKRWGLGKLEAELHAARIENKGGE